MNLTWEGIMRLPRKGDWIQTYTGKQFWPFDPRPEDVDIKDIAHALSNLCRFSGHVTEFYSVAQHSVLVSHWCEQEMAGLLHDAAEAYVTDMPRPIKHDPRLAIMKVAEEQILLAVYARYRIEAPLISSDVIAADRWLLAAEARDFMHAPEWADELRATVKPPLERVPPIVAWGPQQAEYEFLLRFYEIIRPI